MREEIMVLYVFCFLCIVGTIVITGVCFWRMRRQRAHYRKLSARYEKMKARHEQVRREQELRLNRAADDADMIIVIYSPQKKKTEFVSESAGWRFGLNRNRIMQDAACLFEEMHLSLKDEMICEFLQEELELSQNKDYAILNARGQRVRCLQLRMSPCGRGRNMLTIMDCTLEYEKEENLREVQEERWLGKQERILLLHYLAGMIEEKMSVEEITMASFRKVLEMITPVVQAIESGGGKVNRDAVSVDALMKEITESVMPLIKDRGQKFELDLQMEDETVMVDKEKLVSVVGQLLKNASMYTQENGTIRLSVSQQTEEKKEFVIMVEDDGIGITEEFMPKLFEPFERADDPRVRSLQGCGLGLVTVRQLLRRMGGRIEVDSEAGNGSCFRVYLELEHE